MVCRDALYVAAKSLGARARAGEKWFCIFILIEGAGISPDLFFEPSQGQRGTGGGGKRRANYGGGVVVRCFLQVAPTVREQAEEVRLDRH